jgi:hypothetical protein
MNPSLAEISKLEKKKKQALRNSARQKRKAQLGIQTRVSFSFWDQVARDYENSILSLKRTKLC